MELFHFFCLVDLVFLALALSRGGIGPRCFAEVGGDEVAQVQVENDGNGLANPVPSRNEEVICLISSHVVEYVFCDQGVGAEDKVSLVFRLYIIRNLLFIYFPF